MNLAETARSCHACDFHVRLLALGERDQVQALLRDALTLAVDGTKARRGHLELHGDHPGDEPRCRLIHRADPEDAPPTSLDASRGRSHVTVPIGGSNPIGFIALWSEAPVGRFTAADRGRVELIARQLVTCLACLDRRAMTRSSLSYREATRQFKRRLLQDALERNNWNIAKTARQLDIRRAHLYNLLADHGLRRPKHQAA